MRRILFSFLFGLAIGASVIVALIYLAPKSDNEKAIETLDFLIDEWTSERGEILYDDRQAQFPARIELPDAHRGFFPDTVLSLARRIQSLYRIPKGVTLSQWALESSWGRNNLSCSNYFGITYPAVRHLMVEPKFVLRREKTVRNDTIVPGKVVAFASFKSISECFDVYGRYISQSNRYRRAFLKKSQEDFARALSDGGYAEDPGYGLKLITIMRRYKL